MVKVPPIPSHLWQMFTGLFSAGPGLILWRIILLVVLTVVTVVAWSATGGSGLAAIILGFAITSVLSYALRDDILAVWSDLWNARWASVNL